MIQGRTLLRRIKTESVNGTDPFLYNGMVITRASLERGIELYEAGINKFLGNSLIKRLEQTDFISDEEIRKRLIPQSNDGNGEWIDLAGLIVPKGAVEKLLDEIEAGAISSVEELSALFLELHRSYNTWEWTWSCHRIEEEYGIPANKLTAKDIINIVERWKKSVIELDKLLYDDARKEFTLSAMTGFGIDGGDEDKKLDFEQVRGEFESNSVVAAIQEHIKRKTALGDELIERLKRIG